jgi:hypothetical protein
MRRLLWTYILAASRATSGDINDPTHGLRLQRATEVLRNLRQDGIPPSGQSMEGSSFIEQVEALLTYYDSQQPSRETWIW